MDGVDLLDLERYHGAGLIGVDQLGHLWWWPEDPAAFRGQWTVSWDPMHRRFVVWPVPDAQGDDASLGRLAASGFGPAVCWADRAVAVWVRGLARVADLAPGFFPVAVAVEPRSTPDLRPLAVTPAQSVPNRLETGS
jgi:hypothetical protein